MMTASHAFCRVLFFQWNIFSQLWHCCSFFSLYLFCLVTTILLKALKPFLPNCTFLHHEIVSATLLFGQRRSIVLRICQIEDVHSRFRDSLELVASQTSVSSLCSDRTLPSASEISISVPTASPVSLIRFNCTPFPSDSSEQICFCVLVSFCYVVFKIDPNPTCC